MIIDLYQIFRARRNPRVAATLAAKLARGQLLDRLSAPFFIIHVTICAIIIASGLLSLVFFLGAARIHETVGLLAWLFAGVAFAALYIGWAFKRGIDIVRRYAEDITDRQFQRAAHRLKPVTDRSHPASAPVDTDETPSD